MKLKNLVYLPALISLVVFLFYSSCKKDNLVELQGIENDTTVCDTSFFVSYQNDILPILQFTKHPATKACYSCHDEANYITYAQGIRLDTYDLLKFYADNGQLVCAVKRTGCANAKPMPDAGVMSAGEKLTNCDIMRIEVWVNQGFPNN